MFSRRRSRGHYDPRDYNAGISTPSASASAAANAFYLKQLGPSAAAEALRRHSLDQSGADAVRNFRAGGSGAGAAPAVSRGPPARRANSMTLGGATGVGGLRGGAAPRSYRSPSLSQAHAPLSQGPPSRRNSLTSNNSAGGRRNSLTRTHTVVNRDAQGRTLSLTTTTIRQMGSFELVQTKDVPISTPGRFGSRTNSLKSMDSELLGIREEPEEDYAELEGRLNRLGADPPIAEEPEEEPEMLSRSSLRSPPRRTAGLASSGGSAHSQRSSLAVPGAPTTPRSGTGTAHHEPGSPQTPPTSASAALQSPPTSSATTTYAADGYADDQVNEDDDVGSDISDATPSPASQRSGRGFRIGDGNEVAEDDGEDDLHAPQLGSEPLHREVSPVRSALRTGSTPTPKTKVSFGGADEPYVYESYEYDDEPLTAQAAQAAAPSAAAAAAVRSRASPSTTSYQQQQQQQQQQQNRRRLVMSQPVFSVEKRPSQTSLSGRSSARSSQQQQQPSQSQASQTSQSSSAVPYPHARPWTVSNETFVDAPSGASSDTELPVPVRNAARPRSQPSSPQVPQQAQWGATSQQPQQPQQQQPQRSSYRGSTVPSGPSLGGLPGSGELGLNGLPKIQQEQQQDEEPAEDHIRAQAIALAQAAFNSQQQQQQQHSPVRGGSSVGETDIHAQAKAQAQQIASSHHYRSLVDDDAASVRSDSSFTRERRRGGTAPSGSVGRMRSLRKPAAPTLRNGAAQSKKGGRKGSLLNQAPPNLDMNGYGGSVAAAPTSAPSAGAGGFRTFSLRNTQRPDPSSLLSGTTPKQSRGKQSSGGGIGGAFRSRIADSDSEDDGPGFMGGGRSGGGGKRSANGKISFGDVFSPSTDVKDIFKSRASSDGAVPPEPRPKKKGFFKRVFGKKE